MFLVCVCLASLALLTSGIGDVSIFIAAQTFIVILGVAAYLLKYIFDNLYEKQRLNLKGDFLLLLMMSLGLIPAVIEFVGVMYNISGVLFISILILLVFFIGYSIFMSRLSRIDLSEPRFDLKRYSVLALTLAVTMIIIGFLLVSLMMVKNGFI